MSDTPPQGKAPAAGAADAETLEAPQPPRTRPAHADPEHVGPYRVIERVGEGGMGIVYRAEQRDGVRRVVALKVIRAGMDTEDVVARFEAERQALALMNHPSVARVYEAGVADSGRPYFAMEYVAGVPLTRYCDDNKLSTGQRLELFIPVCNAVQHAHQKGIIHRDLKPSNILVTLVDGKPVPKVIDFGIAKATNQQLTQKTLYTRTGALIGTPEYMSPEQAMTSGLDVDTRTDVYSLGVILYELLTGTLPFDPKTLRDAGLEGMARIIRETEPAKPSARLTVPEAPSDGSAGSGTSRPATRRSADPRMLRKEIRGDLDWITLKAMEKDRTRRYDSAGALAADVRRHLDNEPVLARPPSTGYRLSKFVRKHRLGVGAGAAVAAAVVVGLVLALWGWARAAEQSRIATVARNAEAEQRQVAEGERAAAQAARNTALKARDEANEANAFLRDLFMSFGNVASARQRLYAAVKRLDEGWLKDQPDTHVSTRIALGYFFNHALNDPAMAEKQFLASLDLVRRPDGTHAPQAAGAIRVGLAGIYANRNENAKAEKLLQEALADFRHSPGYEAATAEVLFALAEIRETEDDNSAGKALRLDALGYLLRDRSRDVAARPDDATAYAERAAIALRLGRFDDAMLDFVKATALAPDDHWPWYRRACLHAYLGDDAGYRAAAGEMFRRFARSERREVAERTAKVCLLTPTPVGDPSTLSRLADAAVAPGASPGLAGWFRMCKGMAEYRTGKYEAALDSLFRARSVDSESGRATAELFAAMAAHRLGKTDEAREVLARAIEKGTALGEPGKNDLGSSPENYLVYHIIRREAEALIAPLARPQNP